ncbi:O-methyltransferase [Salinisphaera orenii]|nr:class I SAM-dependent methyltransferase [Salinisphaera halophila]
MLKKLYKRINDTRGERSATENYKWLRENRRSFSAFAESIDQALWRESETVARRITEAADARLREVEYDLGGGGVYPLLYFITRLMRPTVVVETGVAAGYSSAAFLEALEANAHGELYSSDFPYFRIPDPERYIGIVVDDSVKHRWHLYVEGDENNLRAIVDEVPAIDLFHYDSDKSYSGREQAWDQVRARLASNAVVLFDDIQDNSFFMDFVGREGREDWYVFEFNDKYIGLVGTLKRE